MKRILEIQAQEEIECEEYEEEDHDHDHHIGKEPQKCVRLRLSFRRRTNCCRTRYGRFYGQ